MATPTPSRLQQQQRRQKSTPNVPRVGERLNPIGMMSASLHTSRLEESRLRPVASSTPLAHRLPRQNLTAAGGVQPKATSAAQPGQASCGGRFSKIRENVRIRPHDGQSTGPIAVKSDENGRNLVCVSQEGGKISEFVVDTVLGAESTQQQVYEAVTAGLPDEFTAGKNTCVFAYGTTGSGKTHSILGTAVDPGILPRFCSDLFNIIDTGKEGTEFMLEVSFYELYQEKAYDLLANGGSLAVRGTGPFHLDKLTVVPVNKLSEVKAICDQGMRRRATAATLNNEMSSRSHAIFQLTLRRNHCEVLASGEVLKSVVVSNCYFVDLAGSEGASDNLAETKQETKAINQSLLTLGRVITAKSEGQPFFNYRDSLLTRLLQECFGGNSATSLLATISPEPKNVGSTLNTLRFAAQAALVKQTPIVNIDPTVRELRELRELNEELRRENKQLLLMNTKATDNNDALPQTRHSEQQLNSSHCWSPRPEPPCVVELLPDEALNVWTSLPEKEADGSEGFIEFGTAVGNTPCVRIARVVMEGDEGPPKSAESTAVSLRVLSEVVAEVVLNGKLLQPNEETRLQHGDRLVVDGTRFLLFLNELAPAQGKALPTYHQVKLEYTEAIAPIIQKRLLEAEREELEEDNRETVSKLNAQIEELHRKMAEYRSRLEQEPDANRAAEIGQQLDSAKEQVEADEEMKEELHEAMMNASQCSMTASERELNEEEKEQLTKMSACIATLNNIVSFFHHGKPKFQFKLTTRGDGTTPYVRIVDAKRRLYADVNPNEFTQLYERVVELYGNTSVAADGIAQLDDAIHGGEWLWKKCVAGIHSNLFATALYNCMHDMAERRGSSVAELDRSFRARRSFITEVIDAATRKGMRVEKPLLTQLQLIKSSPAVDGHDGYYDFPLTNLLLKSLVHVSDSLECAAKGMGEALNEDGQVVVNYEQEQAAIHSMMQFTSSVESMRWLVAGLERYPTCDHVLDEMRTLTAAIQRDAKRWVVALAGGSKNSEFFVRRVGINLKLLVRLIGRLSFYRDEKFPCDEKDSAILNNRQEFEEGVMKSVEDACDDALENWRPYKYPTSSTDAKSRVISILFKCIRAIHAELRIAYDANLDCELLRPLIVHKNKLIQNSSKTWSSLHGKLKALKPVAKTVLQKKKGASIVESGLSECLEILAPISTL